MKRILLGALATLVLWLPTTTWAQDSYSYLRDILVWPINHRNITVVIDPSLQGLRPLIEEAFSEWEEASDGGIRISFRDLLPPYPHAGERGTWTATDLLPEVRQYGFDILIKGEETGGGAGAAGSTWCNGGNATYGKDWDAEKQWPLLLGIERADGVETQVDARTYQKFSDISIDYSSRDEECLKSVFLHEIGHALFCDGHSSDPGDIMSTWGSNYTLSGLSQKDINTLRTIYPADIYPPGQELPPTFGYEERTKADLKNLQSLSEGDEKDQGEWYDHVNYAIYHYEVVKIDLVNNRLVVQQEGIGTIFLASPTDPLNEYGWHSAKKIGEYPFHIPLEINLDGIEFYLGLASTFFVKSKDLWQNATMEDIQNSEFEVKNLWQKIPITLADIRVGDWITINGKFLGYRIEPFQVKTTKGTSMTSQRRAVFEEIYRVRVGGKQGWFVGVKDLKAVNNTGDETVSIPYWEARLGRSLPVLSLSEFQELIQKPQEVKPQGKYITTWGKIKGRVF